jgi:peptide/nickel transport system permease protein
MTESPVVPGVGRRGPSSLRWTPGLVGGAVLFAAVVVVAVVAPLTMAGAASELTGDTNLPVSGAHPLGTDSFGRDLLARALVATQLSLVMTLFATVISVVLGVLIGTSIWIAPRRVREASLRVLETVVSYPELLVAVVIAAILGSGSWQLVLAIGIANIPSIARLTANLAASVYQRDFVVTARLLGVPNRLIITKHLLPNMAEPLLIQVASSFSIGLVSMSALSFVGLGVQTPEYDLGRLLADSLPAIYSRPIEVVGPTAMIIVMSLAAMLIGDGLAAAADPRSSRVRLLAPRMVPRATAGEATGSFVSVDELSVYRSDGVELVHGISFTIERGEILGVVGESGSGKSLTAMALARLLPDGLRASASELRIGEMDMLADTVSPKDLATSVALVYQDPGTTFNPALVMKSQLTEVLRVHRRLSKEKARTAILAMLAKVHIVRPERLLESHPFELSGGMRQRAMIASALATDPVLIVADEPTTALDVTVQAEILREFRRINRSQSTSMLFISHDIGVVEALCDRILVMKDGEIVEVVARADLARGEVTHPYTRMLLETVPRLTDERKARS